jgi:hypothetical protein
MVVQTDQHHWGKIIQNGVNEKSTEEIIPKK